MPTISPADAAVVFRDAVTALSERLAGDYGELVPDASMERTTALLSKLTEGSMTSARGIRLADAHVATLDDIRANDANLNMALYVRRHTANGGGDVSARRISSVIRISPDSAAEHNRLAVFTVSPMTVNSSRRSEPMFPANASP